MVNNNFYLTINDLCQRASGGTAGQIIDYKSFIDVGTALTSLANDDFKNAFAAEIANKVKLSIDTARDYAAKLTSLERGQLSPNGVIELITHGFYETREAAFVSLTDNASVDMYKINKGTQYVDYFVKDNAYQIPVTIQSLELEGAFKSPEAMDMFLQNKIKYAMNSNAIARENGRRGLLADLIVELIAEDAAATADSAAQRYKLVKLFNDTYYPDGAEGALTSENALYNSEFVKFAVMMIKKTRKKLTNPSVSFNTSGVKTFTPEGDTKLITIDALDSAIVGFKNTFSPDATELGDHEAISYWQAEATPFIVNAANGKVVVVGTDAERGTDTTKYYYVKATGKTYTYGNAQYTEVVDFDPSGLDTEPVIAVLFDTFAVGEFLTHEAVHTTPFNAAGEYWNNWINVQTKYCRNKNANAVVFTLEDA